MGEGDKLARNRTGELPTNQTGKYRALIAIFLFIFIVIVQLTALTRTSVANDQFDAYNFIQEVEAYQLSITTRHPTKSLRDKYWLTTTSPWHPYLQKQFVEGLSKFGKSRHNDYVEQGNCEKAALLEISGMLDLYPRLRAVFDNSEIRSLFSTAIHPLFSFANNRCKANRIIRPLIREAKIMSADRGMHFDAYEVQLHISNSVHKPARPVNLDEIQLTTALHTLVKLALCYHYHPAIVDLVQTENELRFVAISGISGYYFCLLAKKMGYRRYYSDQNTIEKMSVLERGEIPRIEKLFGKYSIEKASNILSYRIAACRSHVPRLP